MNRQLLEDEEGDERRAEEKQRHERGRRLDTNDDERRAREGRHARTELPASELADAQRRVHTFETQLEVVRDAECTRQPRSEVMHDGQHNVANRAERTRVDP